MKGYITLQEAAALLGVSRQTITRRARAAGRSMDGPRTALDGSLDHRPASIVKGKNRYISMDWVQAEQEAAAALDGPSDKLGRSMDGPLDSLDSNLDSKPDSLDTFPKATQRRILDLERDLLAAQGEVSALQATVTAQEAHIDSLKTALDREQALHMASLQQRLPAGRGSSFMDWIKGWGKKQQ